jgi:hypothetical protein
MGEWVQKKHKFQQDKYNIMADITKHLKIRKHEYDQKARNTPAQMNLINLINKNQLDHKRRQIFSVQSSRNTRNSKIYCYSLDQLSKENFLESKAKITHRKRGHLEIIIEKLGHLRDGKRQKIDYTHHMVMISSNFSLMKTRTTSILRNCRI